MTDEQEEDGRDFIRLLGIVKHLNDIEQLEWFINHYNELLNNSYDETQ